jgi:hypothetical protein
MALCFEGGARAVVYKRNVAAWEEDIEMELTEIEQADMEWFLNVACLPFKNCFSIRWPS